MTLDESALDRLVFWSVRSVHADQKYARASDYFKSQVRQAVRSLKEQHDKAR